MHATTYFCSSDRYSLVHVVFGKEAYIIHWVLVLFSKVQIYKLQQDQQVSQKRKPQNAEKS